MRNTLALALLLLAYNTFAQSVSFAEKTTNASNVRLNVSNYGTFGNAFRGYRDGSGDPSCEYPAGSGVEHLFEGGIWIGVKNGGQTLVSTSAYDQPQGYAPGRGGFEFSAEVGSTLNERSTLNDSRSFSLDAVSHQDFVADFSDKNTQVPGTSIPIAQHTNPLNVDVHMETYNWNFTFTDFLVIVNLQFINKSNNTYQDTYLGLWNNTVVRNINVTPAGAGGAAFYNKGGNGYMDSLYLAYCYDAAGDIGFTDSYIGQKFLGVTYKDGFHHPDLPLYYNPLTDSLEEEYIKINYQAWDFNSSSSTFFFPTNDNARYTKMSTGLNHNICWTNPTGGGCNLGDVQALLNAPGNRSDLLSAGPFNNFAPGDTINISYAYVLAKKVEDGNPNTDNNIVQRGNLISNAGWAQQAFNGEDQNFNGILDPGEDADGNGKITRFILPSPPDIPQTKIISGDNKIDIYWTDNSLYSVDPISSQQDFEGFRVYLSKVGFDVTGVPDLARDFKLLAEYDLPANGYANETGLDAIALDQPATFEGDSNTYYFKYTINNIPNGWQNAVAVTAFDQGNPENNLESLESSFLANDFRVFTGTASNADMEANQPFVYPNPYYYGAAWEGVSNFQEESRKIIFANLPARCEIRIYTAAGDFIDAIEHNQATYTGEDIRWFKTFGAENPEENVFSGGEHAWDLLSLNSQIISRGLYMFSVKDLDTGKEYLGKFIIIK